MLFQACSLLLVIVGTYALKHLHVFGERDYKVAQGLVFNLTLPCAIILSFATNKHDMRMLWIVLFGFFACLIPLFVVYFGSRGDERNYRAFQMLNASGLNLGAFCLPVVQTFMGASAGLPIIMLDIGNATVATAGSLTITRTLLKMDDNFKALPWRLRLRNIARDFLGSISFDIYMLMLVFMFLRITIPQPIVTLITPFANANAFCAMAMIGLMMEVPDNRKDKVELAKVIAWRAVFGVIIALAAWFLLPFDARIREIIVLGAFAPVTIFSTKFTDSLTGNAKLAGFSLTVTAIIGLVVMTVLHALLPTA
ncbi:AEC family transporter [Bifidobacterium callitrichos]|uniref:Transporter, auxin efflux carrier domain protein n=1 Tax=Bifidobacterium callitrichos DSM 23973 TaxID=1437609 RepID=A0A087A5M5_9BIFI|nr:transporter [Bifidobacterium callitrichos]KFI54075.1 transporter, auxin efflux carrier domain protein [Bifidobacterium callitrichos DSM 23973]